MNIKDEIKELKDDLIRKIKVINKKDIDYLIGHDLANFDYVGKGSSRIVYKQGNFVYKIALNPAGLAQNSAERSIYEGTILYKDKLNKVIDSFNLFGLDYFILKVPYAPTICDYFESLIINANYDLDFNFSDEDFHNHTKVICIINKILETNYQGIINTDAEKVLIDCKERIEKRFSVKRSYKFYFMQFMIPAYDKFIFDYRFQTFVPSLNELNSRNIGVQLNFLDNGNVEFKNFVLIDYGFTSYIADKYKNEEYTFLKPFEISELLSKC